MDNLKQEKSRVVVFGLGGTFVKNRSRIEEFAEIVAFSDNFGQCSQNVPYVGEVPYLSPDRLKEVEFDIIIISSNVYYTTIKYQLIYIWKIEEEKICGLHSLPVIRSDKDKKQEKDLEDIVFSSVEKYQNLNKDERFLMEDKNMWLMTDGISGDAGGISSVSYFVQDIWAASKIHDNMPLKHYDIGSRIDGFLSHLMTFCDDINYVDIRPMLFHLPKLKFVQADATNMDNFEDGTISSLSSLSAVEHFGLGRYGDEIDPEACFKAMKAFQRVLKKEGKLYFGVPVGSKNVLQFNAQRIFHPNTVIETMDQLELVEFAVVNSKTITADVIKEEHIEEKIGLYGDHVFGLFEFKKK